MTRRYDSVTGDLVGGALGGLAGGLAVSALPAGRGRRLLLSMGLGAVYGLVRRRIPGPPAAAGALFGLGVLPIAYVAAEAAALTAPLREEEAGRPAQRVLALALFGAFTGLVTELAAQRVHPSGTRVEPG